MESFWCTIEPVNRGHATQICTQRIHDILYFYLIHYFCRLLFSFYRLTFTFRHFLGESLFSMFFDIADASRAVGVEQECEYLANEIEIYLALGHVLMTFGTSMEIMTSDA